MKVKVCGMKNRENIREIVACKPDFLGFVLYPPSPRYIGERFDPRLMRSIPPYISKVGVFVDEDPELIVKLVAQYNLDYVQLHGHEEPSYAASLKAKKISVIKSFPVDDRFDFSTTEPFIPHCDAFLFDAKSDLPGGSGKQFNWQLLQQYQCGKPFLLGGGIRPEDAETVAAIKHGCLLAVDINSGFETGPGLKDAFRVSEFIKTIKRINP